MLTEGQRQIRDVARQFAARELAPTAAERDRIPRFPRFPREAFARMGDLGMLGMTVPEEFDGIGADYVSYALAIMEIAAADGASSTVFQVHNSLVCLPILRHGTPQQKERILRPLARGELLGAFCLTEPNAGSDAATITTRAERVGNKFVLNGAKQFITSGLSADIALVFAVTDPAAGKQGISAFIVPTSTPGYTVARVEHTMGQRSSDHCHVVFDDCQVLPEQMLGDEGAGLRLALGNLEGGRIGVAAQSVGMARAAYDAALAYAKQRRTFGKAIIEHQAIAFRLADMATSLQAAELMVLNAAHLRDEGRTLSQGGVDGQALRLGDGREGLLGGHSDPRRLRLPQRLPGRTHLSRRARHHDLRGHVRHPATGDRPADRQ